MIVKDIRQNSDIKSIVLHHSTHSDAQAGSKLNQGYMGVGYFGLPYDILINLDGTIDLPVRWTFASNAAQYLKNVAVNSIIKYKKHYLGGMGETYYWNKHAIHIVLAGNFDVSKPALAQRVSLVTVLNLLCWHFQINPKQNLYYHNEIARTSCPGTFMLSKTQLIYSLNIKTTTANPDPRIPSLRSIEITSPTSGSSGKQYHSSTITWITNNISYVDLSYSLNDQNNWVTLATFVSGNSFSWNLPAVTSDSILYIKAAGSNLPDYTTTSMIDLFTQLTIINPSGSTQTYASGSTIPLEWSNINVPTASIDYSYDESNWVSIVTGVAGSTYNWAYPGAPSSGSTVYIRVKEYPNAYVSNINFFKDNTVSFLPSDISNILFWFNDTGLSNPSSNNFSWIDSISGGTSSGNYGTGDGIKTLNSRNVLHTVASTSGGSSFTISLTPAMTFFWIWYGTSFISAGNAAWYIAQSNNYFIKAGCIDGANVGSFNNYLAGSSKNVIEPANTSFYSSWNIVCATLDGNNLGLTKLYTQGITYNASKNFTFTTYPSYNINIGGSFSYVSNPWQGYIGEFLGYSKILNTSEINQVGGYYYLKYGLPWIAI